MITKSTIAHKVAKLGIAVHIANGTKENILTDVLANKVIHTRFTPTKKASGKKKWLAHSENAATGVVQVNEGAKTVLVSSKASSLLPVGIINIISDFKKGEIIKIIDEQNKTIGLGLAEYGSDKAANLRDKRTRRRWYITITFICRDNNMSYKHYFENALIAGRNAALSPAVINKVLLDVAKAAIEQTDYLLQENKKDLERMDPADPKYDRLNLTADRIKAISGDMENVAELDNPLGKVLSEKTLPNGLYIKKVRVPLGVVGVIYEARPNVTFDVFALCFKTGNISILKGGSDADNSNRAIIKIIHGVLSAHNIDVNFATLLPVEREATEALLNAVGFVDVLISRGSQSLINYVRDNSKVPVIETGAGIVHTYFDETGDLEKAIAIIDNAKTRRVSVCNALDCLIINSKRLGDLVHITEPLGEKGVKIYADKKAYEVLDSLYPTELLEQAQPEHFGTEFLSMTMSIKTVDTLEQALEHIAVNSSKHSEAIISEDELNIETFLNRVDAAAVYVNTSTAFTDGAQFGLGAEIGISTQKLHARGPMGLEELTSYKWIVKGNGQIRKT